MRRRRWGRRVFLVGLIAGVGHAALREFRALTSATPLLGLVWLACLAAYVGVGLFPSSLAQDLDAPRPANPWQPLLEHLSSGRTQVEALALLAGPLLASLLFSFISFAFHFDA